MPSTNHSDEVNAEVLLTHFLFDVHKSSLGNRLGVDFEALLKLAAVGYCLVGLPRGNPRDLFHRWPF